MNGRDFCAAFLAVMTITGCGSGSGDSASGKIVVHESDFVGRAVKPDTIAMLDLEAAGTHDGDTGGPGVDEVPLAVETMRNYRFCIEEGEINHAMEVVDQAGVTLASATVEGGCAEAVLDPGHYILRFHHGAKGDSVQPTDRLFLSHVRPVGSGSHDGELSDDAAEPAVAAMTSSLWPDINELNRDWCMKSSGHKLFDTAADTESPRGGELFFYTEAGFKGCRWTITGDIGDIQVLPKSYKLGPDSIFISYRDWDFPSSDWDAWRSTGSGRTDSDYSRTNWIKSVRVISPRAIPVKIEDAATIDLAEGELSVHAGSGPVQSLNRIHVLKGAINDVNRLLYINPSNPSPFHFFSNTNHVWFTLGPNTGATVTYQPMNFVGGLVGPPSGAARSVDIINDSSTAKAFDSLKSTTSVIGNRAIAVHPWRLKSDVDANEDFLVRASVNHCRDCDFYAADLTGLDMSGYDFSHADFRYAKLRSGAGHSDWSGTKLDHADLRHADADHVDFRGASFNGANLGRADLSACNLENANFDSASLANVDFTSSDFACASVTHTNLSTANLDYLIINDARADHTSCRTDFSHSTNIPIDIVHRDSLRALRLNHSTFTGITAGYFSGGIFDFAEMDGINFHSPDDSSLDLSKSSWSHASAVGARMTGAVFTGSTWDYADLTKADLSHSYIESASMRSATLRQANFSASNIQNVDFSSSILEGVQDPTSGNLLSTLFNESILKGVNFSDARLSLADFSYADWTEVNVTRSLLDNTKFRHAWLAGTDLSSATSARGADFSAAWLMNANLSALDLTPANDRSAFVAARIQGTNFENANLAGAAMHGASASFSDGSIDSVHLLWDSQLGEIVSNSSWTVTYGTTKKNAVTTGDTQCPSGSYGPCDNDSLWIYTPPPGGGGIDPDDI